MYLPKTILSGLLVSIFTFSTQVSLASPAEDGPGTADTRTPFCPEGFSLLSSHRLCVTTENALGPFSPKMVADCIKFGGGVSCNSASWNVNFAKNIRGTGVCMPGTTLTASGLCVAENNAWGPFSRGHVANCQDAGGGPVCQSMRWPRSLAEATLPVSTFPWGYIASTDFGIRTDGLGDGGFRAPRSGGRMHAGVDYLYPLNTPLFAPCDGAYSTGFEAAGYGSFVVVVCRIPSTVAGNETLFASMLFGHLNSVSVGAGRGRITKAQQLGRVGKTGNANSPSINPHLHLDLLITTSEAAGLAAFGKMEEVEKQADVIGRNVNLLLPRLRENCLTPTGFRSNTSLVYGNYLDPFILISCLNGSKPVLQRPGFQSTFVPWSRRYQATTFNVDVGQR